MSIQTILNDLGLEKSKGAIYLAALSAGAARAQDIAALANLPRTTAHEILQQLVGLGLVSFITKGRTRFYTAEPPSKLKFLLKEKERRLETIIPELNSLVNAGGTKPRVRFYEGIPGIKTILEDTLTVKNKVLLGFLSMVDLYEVPGKDYMDDYVKRRVAQDIKLKVIRSETKDVEEVWRSSDREKRDLHYAPKNMLFPMTIYIYDKKVSLIGAKKENFGMIIESEDFNFTFSNLFNVLWEVSRAGKKID